MPHHAEAPHSQRLDQWLYMARFVKTRSLAQKLCAGRKIRINGQPVTKASRMVMPGQILTMAIAREIRVVRILELAVRRGPASEAALLYENVTD